MNGKSTEIKYNGKTYKSIAKLAKELNLNPDNIYSRLFYGWNLEKAIETEIRINRRVIEYNGKQYPTIKSLSNELGFPYVPFAHHINRYNDVNIAIERMIESLKKEPIKAFGNEFNTYTDISKKYGISHTSLIRRLNEGESIENAILKTLESETITFNGKTYKRFRDLCAEYKIQPSNIYGRLTNGFSLEEALTKPIRPATNGITINYRGKQYPSYISLCREFGINYNAVREIVHSHPSLSFMNAADCYIQMKETVGIPNEEQTYCIPRMVINGKIYDTIRKFAEENNIKPSVLNSALSKSNEDDIIEQLKKLQDKTVPRYQIEGKIYQYKELKESFSTKQLYALEKHKILYPMYEFLQKFDFNDNCWDTKRLMNELIQEYNENQEGFEITM